MYFIKVGSAYHNAYLIPILSMHFSKHFDPIFSPLKSKTPKIISFKSYLVAGAGLEPTTFGL